LYKVKSLIYAVIWWCIVDSFSKLKGPRKSLLQRERIRLIIKG